MSIPSDVGFILISWVCVMLTIVINQIIKPEQCLNGQKCRYHQDALSDKAPVFLLTVATKRTK